MSWGYRILIVYGVFISGIACMVIMSSLQNRDLVAQDYYEQELKFQDKIDYANNAAFLSSRFILTQQKDTLKISLPQEMKGHPVKAKILLYSPADEKKDMLLTPETGNAELFLILPASYKGLYKVKAEWQCGGKTFYDERKIVIS